MARAKVTTDDDGADAPSAPRDSAPRMSVQLTGDGSIAWDRIRPSTREQLKRALSDGRVAEQLGLANGHSGGELPDAFDPSMTGIVYDTLSNFMIALARRQGYTLDQAGVLRFTDDEKGQLAGPTARVLNKYAGQLGPYQDELTLGVALATCIAGKLTLLRRSATVHPFSAPAPPAIEHEPAPSA